MRGELTLSSSFHTDETIPLGLYELLQRSRPLLERILESFSTCCEAGSAAAADCSESVADPW